MAMCTTGNLSICSTAGTCRSISTAVGTGSGSLCALSVSVGCGAPHCMREFYGYNPPTATLSVFPFSLDFTAFPSTSKTVTVTASAGNSWFALPSETWISVTSGSGTGSGSFSVRPNGNEGYGVRSGVVTVSSSAPERTISVTQDPNV